LSTQSSFARPDAAIADLTMKRSPRTEAIEWADPDDLALALLTERGMGEEDIRTFLNPNFNGFQANGLKLLGMTDAVARICDGLERGERIVCFGDYDVDGVTSCSIMLRGLKLLVPPCAAEPDLVEGAIPNRPKRFDFYIPHRMLEGYGPNTPALLKIKEDGADLVLCLDSGTLAIDPLTAAHQAGLDVVVIDHHIGLEAMPPAVAIVNPNRFDEAPEMKKLFGGFCAAGLSFLTLTLVRSEMIRRGHWPDEKSAPKVGPLIDLAALGTVADVMKLIGYNRAIVKYGLEFMDPGRILQQGGNLGLYAMAEVITQEGKSPRRPNAGTLGFQYGPRVNAAGRMDRADPGVELLTTTDLDRARELAGQLHLLNAERQATQEEVLRQAEEMIPGHELMADMPPGIVPEEVPSCLILAGAGWHPGCIGIVAGRLREKYKRPTVIISIDPEKGIGKGSGRSAHGFDLGGAIIEAAHQNLLGPKEDGFKGGGHAAAAGLTIRADMVDIFRQYMIDRTAGLVEEEDRFAIVVRLEDGRLVIERPSDPRVVGKRFGMGTIRGLEKLEPFGTGNPRPRILVRNARIHRYRLLSQGKHMKLDLMPLSGGTNPLPAVAWRSGESPLGPWLQSKAGQAVEFWGELEIDTYTGTEILQLKIEGAREPRG